ncbi:hypothetical protein CFC21_043374 [Triticum aestivum]|uniref:F-box domain-containing protein n=3 Tax=Triticum TaxID=4564 RepID=A0A9R1FP97_WHEAT|nr:F-box protein At5g49610-like [Triticum dicoccoides]XP_044351366.1 F-box protein At5g49610-like [Triticum aestivum]KAF7032164.1 hypothetical protein CFC21_043373 [Triticum aestivum]KAF7032165.1 hypothetical protein CFC21_043374 [Triticum aestivum]VAH83160.1 unnamed protein product [Triticum turgidum subsp. durum]
MAEAASAEEAAPLHPGLPDEIFIWEVLVRLPPKALLRCRTVCRAWRRATSARDFLLAHHALQPALPLLYVHNYVGDNIESLDIVPFDRRAGVAADDQLRPVARLGQGPFRAIASCDGLLVFSNDCRFSLCNPATRQYARLPVPPGFVPLGMYSHSPTGKYRLLLYKLSTGPAPDAQGGSYVLVLGSGQPPRCIGCPDARELVFSPSVLFRGGLHWHREQNERIVVFDTTTELFRHMCVPVVSRCTNLFEMDGMLGVSSFNYAAATIDIWMAQDYESEVWSNKHHVELPVAELTMRFGRFNRHGFGVVASSDGHLLMLLKFSDWLLQVDMDGKLVASFHCKDLAYTRFWLKQTLVSHTFFPTLEHYVVNASPFI